MQELRRSELHTCQPLALSNSVNRVRLWLGSYDSINEETLTHEVCLNVRSYIGCCNFIST